MSTREIAEGLQYQGADEVIPYTLTTTNWGTAPASATANIYSINGVGVLTDVTSTNMPGACSVSGDVITLPVVTGLTAGTRYRVEVQFVISGGTYEAYSMIQAER